MSRSFTVQGTREVHQYVTWTVEADSFDEARQKVYDSDYDDVEVDDWEVEDSNVDEVECECGYAEGDCECDSEKCDETDNPNWDSGVAARDLEVGQWIVADDYSRTWFSESNPVRVTEVYGPDSDNEWKVRFEHPDGTRDYWYVTAACRFEVVDAPEEAAELEAKRAAEVRNMNEKLAVARLLAV